MSLYKFLQGNNPDKKFLEINSKNFKPANYTDDLDQRCHETVGELSQQELEFLLLPISITENFTEFSGIVLGHHIRLSSDEKLRKIPIVFYGFIKQIILLKITPLARILLTENVVYVNLMEYEFHKISESVRSYKNKDFDIDNFVKTIELHPPANYDSHHGIDNEYALISWSKYVGCYDKLPEQFRREFNSRLYFKYLNFKYNVKEINDKKQFSIVLDSKTKVLLIDDEEKKGWESFYNAFFQFSPNVKLLCSEIDFKNSQKQSNIIEQIKEKIEAEKPDIVLLDLRLIDNDFEEAAASEQLTGIKALETIKEVNRGIQVIVTTSSNKVWNFNLARQRGAYDFIIKDGLDDPQKSIKKLKDSIEGCTKRAKYLKPIWENINIAIDSWNKYKIPKRKNVSDDMHDQLWHHAVKQNVIDFLNNAYCTLENENQKERFTLSILLLYRILELTKEFFIYQRGNYKNKDLVFYWDQDNSLLPFISSEKNYYRIEESKMGKSISTLNQVYAIYYKMQSSINENLFNGLYDLNDYRNNVAIHPDKRFKKDSLEDLYEKDFKTFCFKITSYFESVCNYVSSFK